jgi:hypothetical protein
LGSDVPSSPSVTEDTLGTLVCREMDVLYSRDMVLIAAFACYGRKMKQNKLKLQS